MSQLLALLLSVAVVAASYRAIKAHPVPFYVAAAVVAVAGVYLTYNPPAFELLRGFAFIVQKGHLGFAFLVIVMFVGVMGDKSAVRRALQPIRGELSIISIILMTAHIVPFLISYAAMLGRWQTMRPSIVAAFAIAAVVLVLFIVLSVTSIKVVKRSMPADTWKRIQWLSYAFFALVFLHLLGYLIVPAEGGSATALAGLAYYVVVYAAYAVLRIRRAILDREGASASEAAQIG